MRQHVPRKSYRHHRAVGRQRNATATNARGLSVQRDFEDHCQSHRVRSAAGSQRSGFAAHRVRSAGGRALRAANKVPALC